MKDGNAAGAAARWMARLRDDRCTSVDETEFNLWLSEDPAHEREFQQLQSVWDSLDRVRNASQIKRVRADALNEVRQAQWDAGSRSRIRHFLQRKKWSVAAALLAVTVLSALSYRFMTTDRVYQTAVGDRRAFQLADGSELVLNTDTRVRVNYSMRTRTVELEHGQAHFKVAHSALRPFLVDAGAGVIRALGTEFDVYRSQNEVRVALVEGKVAVTPTSIRPAGGPVTGDGKVVLAAGQAIVLSSKGIAAVEAARVDQVTAWLDGKLVFNDERLRDAVAEINRYSTRKIVVMDGQLADLRINGIFRIDRADTFIEAVRASLPVSIQSAAQGAFVIVSDPVRNEKVHASH